MFLPFGENKRATEKGGKVFRIGRQDSVENPQGSVEFSVLQLDIALFDGLRGIWRHRRLSFLTFPGKGEAQDCSRAKHQANEAAP